MNEKTRGTMSGAKWRKLVAMVAAMVVFITSFLYQEGVFEEANAVIFGIVGAVLAVIAVALYFYVRGLPDDAD